MSTKQAHQQKKVVGRPFQKGHKLAPGGARVGAGAPSNMHRAECRKLVESLKIRDFFGDVTKGKKVDFTVTMDGKVVNVPASVRNRMFAGLTLMEHGYGRAPQEIQHSISPESLAKFELALSKIFQDFVPKMCPHCRTALSMPEGMADAILKLSEAFEQEGEDLLASV
jgi:hypothetical protein